MMIILTNIEVKIMSNTKQKLKYEQWWMRVYMCMCWCVRLCIYVYTLWIWVCVCVCVCVEQHFESTGHAVELYMPSFVKALTMCVCVYNVLSTKLYEIITKTKKIIR